MLVRQQYRNEFAIRPMNLAFMMRRTTIWCVYYLDCGGDILFDRSRPKPLEPIPDVNKFDYLTNRILEFSVEFRAAPNSTKSGRSLQNVQSLLKQTLYAWPEKLCYS